MPDVPEKTQIHIEQEYLYSLLNQYILSLGGKTMPTEDGYLIEYVPKSDIAQAVAEMLTAHGESEAKRLKTIKEEGEVNNG